MVVRRRLTLGTAGKGGSLVQEYGSALRSCRCRRQEVRDHTGEDFGVADL